MEGKKKKKLEGGGGGVKRKPIEKKLNLYHTPFHIFLNADPLSLNLFPSKLLEAWSEAYNRIIYHKKCLTNLSKEQNYY